MDPEPKLSLPFLTRKMLAFEHAQAFSIRITSQANNEAVITIRGLTREGVFTLSHTTLSTGAVSTETFRLPDVPIMLSVIDQAPNFQQGQCYVTLDLLANNDALYGLCSGYVYEQKSLSYPPVNAQDTKPGYGNVCIYTSSNPAAGAELSLTVPTSRMWRIIALRFQLVAAAVAASRRVHVVFSPGGTPILDAFSDIDQLISETRNYSVGAFPSSPDRLDDDDILIPIPGNILLRDGATITTVTTALNTGDNFGVMSALVEEFFIGT